MYFKNLFSNLGVFLSADIDNSQTTSVLSDLANELQPVSTVFSLSGLSNLVSVRSTDIMRAQSEKSSTIKIRHIFAEEIKAASDGNIIIPHYSPNANAQQEVYVYDGMRWSLVDLQEYQDALKSCAPVIGIPEEYQTNSTFFKALSEDVSHTLSKSMKRSVPKDEVWINMQNGTLKITSRGEVRLDPHSREDYFHYYLPYDYNQEAQCPKWQTFLDQVLPDIDSQKVLQEYLGTCFIKSKVRIEKMLVMTGEGSNGKSVVINVIRAVLGDENVADIPLEQLTTKDETRRMAEHKLMVLSQEMGLKIDTAVLKNYVSCDPILIRTLYKGTRQMTEYGKLLCSCNKLPQPEQTYGYFRRWLLLPFEQTFEGKQADPNLTEKLKEELPGIMNWIIEGLNRFLAQDYHFTVSDVCDQALEKYRKSADSVAMFYDECCELSPDAPTKGMDLFASYRAYCLANELKPEGRNKFFERLEKISKVKPQYPGNVKFFAIRVKNEFHVKS